MPLQNRVNPFGDLCAVDARGMLMGNRGGRLHLDARRIGLWSYVSQRWIACECDFRGRRRNVWGDSYTELFFLDEVTALAAGHRPCFECRRADARHFAALFPFLPGESTNADTMDRLLHRQRLNGRSKRSYFAARDELPDGAMIAHEGKAYTVLNSACLAWTHEGYVRVEIVLPSHVEVLTPPAMIEILQRGYAPRWHASAQAIGAMATA